MAPAIQAADLDAQVDAILALLAKRGVKKKLAEPSRVHDRASLATLVRCAVTAEAIDRTLGKTKVRLKAHGRLVAEEGMYLAVTRLIWNEAKRPQWPGAEVESRPGWHQANRIEAWADFSDVDDPALALLAMQPWARVTPGREGHVRVDFDAAAMAGLVRVEGEYSPALAERGPGLLSPVLGGSEDPASVEDEPASPARHGVWCLVANVARYQEYGVEREVRLGTRHFSPNTKVYCFPPLWGDGYRDIQVIGRHRGGASLVTLIMPARRLTNWRVKLVYHPHVIRELGDHRWTKEDADGMVASIRLWDMARAAKKQGLATVPPDQALVVATLYDLPEEVDLALSRGADLAANWEGWTPLEVAGIWASPSLYGKLAARSVGLPLAPRSLWGLLRNCWKAVLGEA